MAYGLDDISFAVGNLPEIGGSFLISLSGIEYMNDLLVQHTFKACDVPPVRCDFTCFSLSSSFYILPSVLAFVITCSGSLEP